MFICGGCCELMDRFGRFIGVVFVVVVFYYCGFGLCWCGCCVIGIVDVLLGDCV